MRTIIAIGFAVLFAPEHWWTYVFTGVYLAGAVLMDLWVSGMFYNGLED